MLSLLKHIADFFAAQDGSEKRKQLQAGLFDYITQHSSTPYTQQSLSDIITKVQHEVRRYRARKSAAERAKADYAVLQERLATVRGNATRRSAMLADNEDFVRNFKSKKAPSRDRRIVAKERLVDVLAELREKNVRMGAEEREAAAEAKREKAEQKAERKRAREERKAALREEKQLQTEQKQAQEEELKMRQTDVRALQALNLKARQANMERDQHAEAVRRKRIDEKLEKHWISSLHSARAKRMHRASRRTTVIAIVRMSTLSVTGECKTCVLTGCYASVVAALRSQSESYVQNCEIYMRR